MNFDRSKAPKNTLSWSDFDRRRNLIYAANKLKQGFLVHKIGFRDELSPDWETTSRDIWKILGFHEQWTSGLSHYWRGELVKESGGPYNIFNMGSVMWACRTMGVNPLELFKRVSKHKSSVNIERTAIVDLMLMSAERLPKNMGDGRDEIPEDKRCVRCGWDHTSYRGTHGPVCIAFLGSEPYHFRVLRKAA